ncbi:hypothetical protein BOFE_09100 (plasmid) [Candidatus Borrelia fainii]|uniref:Lipoprotein n=1 Tax=Candidatus Borrelia fainii TaxID=2518322 RepID=A0ABM8DL96_9SPIR|nr:hypothetical protein [Candidatus Borrelia fainii]BDU63370.1 hypothetical protein BOFE_09100 [Candidatus Borrelia fainii]
MKKIHVIVLFLAVLIFGCNPDGSLFVDPLLKSKGSQNGMSILQKMGKSLDDKIIAIKEEQVFGVQVSEGEVAGDKEVLKGEEESLEENSKDKEGPKKEGTKEERGLDDSQSSNGVNSVIVGATGSKGISSETGTGTETVASSQGVSKALETLVVAQEASSPTVSVTTKVSPQTVSVTTEEVKSPIKPDVQVSANGGKKAVTKQDPNNKNSNNQGKSSLGWWNWFFSAKWDYEW